MKALRESPAFGLVLMALGLVSIAVAAILRLTYAQTLRIDDVRLPFASALNVSMIFGLGIGALCCGQLLLLFQADKLPDGPPSWREPVLAALGLQVLAALALPLTSNDIFSNILYGHMLAQQGINPYTASPTQMLAHPFNPWIGSIWKTTPCVYGPPTLAIAAFSAMLAGGGGLIAHLVAYKTSLLLVSGGMVWLSYRYARDLPAGRSRLTTFWFLSCSPIWLVEIAGQAHNDGLMILLMMAALVAHQRRRDLLCASLLGLAVAAKYVPAVPLAFLLLWQLWKDEPLPRGRFGRVFLQGLLALGVALLSLVPLWNGLETIIRPFRSISASRFHFSFLKLFYIRLYHRGRTLTMSTLRVTRFALWALLIFASMRWVAGWTDQGEQRELPWTTAMRFILLHTLMLNAHFLPWYLTWLVPLVACERDREWWSIFLTYSTLALFHYSLDWVLPTAQKQPLVTFFIHIPPLVLIVLLSLDRLRARQDRRGFLDWRTSRHPPEASEDDRGDPRVG